jgi:hypothetical protein
MVSDSASQENDEPLLEDVRALYEAARQRVKYLMQRVRDAEEIPSDLFQLLLD